MDAECVDDVRAGGLDVDLKLLGFIGVGLNLDLARFECR
jgi:hypothetical protein